MKSPNPKGSHSLVCFAISSTHCVTQHQPTNHHCTMPQPHVAYTAAAWFVLYMLLPMLRRCGKKPRLAPDPASYDLLLRSDSRCRHVTRFSATELRKLAMQLGIDPDARTTGNWRYRPMHRLVLFVVLFGNNWPSRKLRHVTGWAANAVLNNWRYHIDHIISVLDTPGQ